MERPTAAPLCIDCRAEYVTGKTAHAAASLCSRCRTIAATRHARRLSSSGDAEAACSDKTRGLSRRIVGLARSAWENEPDPTAEWLKTHRTIDLHLEFHIDTARPEPRHYRPFTP